MSEESRQLRREKMHGTKDRKKIAEREAQLDRKYEEQLKQLRQKRRR